ncbi:DJ-1/PfpI family protein [Novosphingobium sp.]|jgi:cyclohexyl-isocyanide hydratase|uniref:DJ-1/PfpI family protein n=1 Tax=Novosphingobium sp. TaxID=1874826 RepID=UPI002FE32928
MGAEEGKPRVLIPVYQGVDLLDVCGPAEMFFWGGLQVDLVAEVPGTIVTGSGVALQVSAGLPVPSTYDALWVPGAGSASLERIIGDPDRTYLDFLIAQAQMSTWVCSVCTGALLLAAAGLLDGYTATTHWSAIPDLLANYPKVTVGDGHPRFQEDRNRLTGGGISSGLDEALRLIEILSGTSAAQEAQRVSQYYPDPPVASLIPNVIVPSLG